VTKSVTLTILYTNCVCVNSFSLLLFVRAVNSGLSAPGVTSWFLCFSILLYIILIYSLRMKQGSSSSCLYTVGRVTFSLTNLTIPEPGYLLSFSLKKLPVEHYICSYRHMGRDNCLFALVYFPSKALMYCISFIIRHDQRFN